jgi:hypothetical protein
MVTDVAGHCTPDYTFNAFCLALIFGPLVFALLTINWWWLAGYVAVVLIFGI